VWYRLPLRSIPLIIAEGQAFSISQLTLYHLCCNPRHPGLQGLTLPWLVRKLNTKTVHTDSKEKQELIIQKKLALYSLNSWKKNMAPTVPPMNTWAILAQG
jgi:hypothetical protein